MTDDAFAYLRCDTCGAIFLSPVPENIGMYYPADYHALPRTREEALALAGPERYKIEIVRAHVSSGRILEIGPGYGSFAGLAKEAGFEVIGVEMDSRCCAFLEETMGIKAIHSRDPAAAVRDLDPVDAAVLWHVVEHLPDPLRTLEAVGRKIRPGGILVAATPNPSAWQFRVMGRKWPHVDAPRHLLLIPSATLARHVEKTGFRIVSVTTTDKGSIGWNTFGWQFFLGNHFRSPRMRAGSAILGRILGGILSPLESREGAGSAYTLVARKKGTE